MTGRTLPLDRAFGPLLLGGAAAGGGGGGSKGLLISPRPSLSSSSSAGLGLGNSGSSSSSSSSSSGQSGIELPVDKGSAHLIGGVGLAVSLLLAAVSLYRLGRFLSCYGWRVGEALRDGFGRKRLGIHLLVLLGALLALPLYSALISTTTAADADADASGSGSGGGITDEGNGDIPGFCRGLLALQRFQVLCALAALGLVLSDWRIDVYEAPLLRARRVLFYSIRDAATAVLLLLAFLLNLAGPCFCLDGGSHGRAEAYTVDTAYLVQVACALLLMASMCYSGGQMKARLVWASRSPLRQSDLFRTALAQLNALLAVCMASFALQVVALLFNYIQLAVRGRSLVPDVWLWVFGAWLPSLGWAFSCLFLVRKARRQSLTTAAAAAVDAAPGGGIGVGGVGGNNDNNYIADDVRVIDGGDDMGFQNLSPVRAGGYGESLLGMGAREGGEEEEEIGEVGRRGYYRPPAVPIRGGGPRG